MSTIVNPGTMTAVSSVPVFTGSTIENDLSSASSYLTTSNSSIVACLTLMIALMYLVVLSWGYRFAGQNAKPLNNDLRYRVQKYATCMYRSHYFLPTFARFTEGRESGLRLLGAYQSD